MSDEDDKPKAAQTVDDLFDDDDDSDDDEMADGAAATVNSNTNINANTGGDTTGTGDGEHNDSNANNNEAKASTNDSTALFGSDDSDDDDDEPVGGAAAAAAGTGAASTSASTSATKKETNNEEEDDDAEFNEDGDIVGKNREVEKGESSMDHDNDAQAGSAQQFTKKKKVIQKQDLVVPDMPLPQFQSSTDVDADANANTNGKKSFHITSLPKIVAIQPAPFSKESYNSNVEEAEYKSRVHSMIRWKYKTSKNGNSGGEEKKERDETTGKLLKESNATIIKWSDGSYGLRVGNEMFDMDQFSFLLNAKKSKKNKFKKDAQPTNPNGNGPTSKDFLYLTQTASTDTNHNANANTVNTPEPSTITILQAVTTLQSKFIPRPSTLHSAAHKQFALESKSRTLNRAKIKTHVSFIDPEKQKQERIRNTDDLMKQKSRSGNRRSYGGGGGGGRRRVGYNRGYMEDDDEYDTVNIRRLKKGTMDDEDMDYGDEDMQSDEEDEWRKKKKRSFEHQRKNKSSSRKRNRFDESDESEDEEEFDDDDDEDDDEGITVRKKVSATNKRKSDLFDEDDDSE